MSKLHLLNVIKIWTIALLINVLATSSLGFLVHAQADNATLQTQTVNTPYTLEYNTNIHGGLTFVGNSLTLSKNGNYLNSVAGTFITTNTSLQASGYPAGTTLNWQQNSSTANMDIPSGSTIDKAFLLWSGLSKNIDVDVSSSLNVPVTLSSGNNQSWAVTSQKTYIADLPPDVRGPVARYTNVADITSYLTQSSSNTYTVSGVPSAITPLDIEGGLAGWIIAVAYKNDSLPIRNIAIFTGFQTIYNQQPGEVVQVSGFSTPANGQLNGRLLVGALEGDATLPGDQMLFGSQSSNLTPVSGPNNIIDNFFAGQINNNSGNLDTTGTFGNLNQTPSSSPEGKRNGLDITSVDISDKLEHNQTSAFSQGTTIGDSYTIALMGTQIDVKAPTPVVTINRDKAQVNLRDTITYTIDVTNDNAVTLQNTTVSSLVPDGTELVPNSITLDGVPVSVNSVNSLNLGDFALSQTKQIVYQVKAIAIPPNNEYRNQATFHYNYNLTQNSPSIPDNSGSTEVVTDVQNAAVDLPRTGGTEQLIGISITITLVILTIVIKDFYIKKKTIKDVDIDQYKHKK